MLALGLSRRWFIACCCGLFIAVSGLGIWLVYRSASEALQAENNLHYSLLALQLVERYVTQTGRWPRGWTELEGLEMRDGPLGGQWPGNSAEMQQRISIDFEVDPLSVARQDRMKFTAIRPKGPFFEYRDYGCVDSLQDAIRESVSGWKPNPTNGPSK